MVTTLTRASGKSKPGNRVSGVPDGVYLAGSSMDMDRAREWYGRLIQAGVTVTSTWIENITRVGQANPRDASDAQRRGSAIGCMIEISAARAIWFLVPASDRPTRGGWSELTAAWGFGKHIVCSGDTKQSIMCALGDEFESDEDAFRHVVGLCMEHRP